MALKKLSDPRQPQAALPRQIAALESVDTALDGRLDTVESDIVALSLVDGTQDARLDALEPAVGALELRTTHVVFHALSSAQASWTSMPAAATLLAGHHRHVARANLASFTQVRLHVNKMGTAGVAGSKMILRYSGSFGTTAATYTADVGTSEVSCAIDATDTFVSSAWIDLAEGAKADVFLAIVGTGGNGATTPQYGTIQAEFR